MLPTKIEIQGLKEKGEKERKAKERQKKSEARKKKQEADLKIKLRKEQICKEIDMRIRDAYVAGKDEVFITVDTDYVDHALKYLNRGGYSARKGQCTREYDDYDYDGGYRGKQYHTAKGVWVTL